MAPKREHSDDSTESSQRLPRLPERTPSIPTSEATNEATPQRRGTLETLRTSSLDNPGTSFRSGVTVQSETPLEEADERLSKTEPNVGGPKSRDLKQNGAK